MYHLLTKCPLFRGLNEDEIKEIIVLGDHTISEFSDGEHIAHKDTAYSGLMILVKGSARGEMTLSDGKTIGIDALEAPELIAPAFLFGGYNKLPIDVIAQGDVTILTLHRGYIFEMMQSNTLILSNFIDIISNRANVWSKKIYFLSFKSLKEKVATYLLEHVSQDNPSLPVPDIKEIAQYFDATRSSVDTVLKDLEKKHIIETDQHSIKVLNLKALQDIVK